MTIEGGRHDEVVFEHCSLILRSCYYNIDTLSSLELISVKWMGELRQFTGLDFGDIIDNAMSMEATYQGWPSFTIEPVLAPLGSNASASPPLISISTVAS